MTDVLAAPIPTPIPGGPVGMEIQQILATSQANILTGHVRPHLVVLGVRVASVERLRAVVGSIVPFVKSAGQHLEERDAFRASGAPGTPFTNLGLSSRAFALAGVDAPADLAFEAGMHDPIHGGLLVDPPVTRWDEAYHGVLHLLVVIGGPDLVDVDQRVATIVGLLGQDLVVTERGREQQVPFPGGPRTVEHFGFVDGVSQPIVIEADLPTASPPGSWNPRAPLRTVLAREPAVAGEPRTYGSFLVYRKLEQDTAAFAAHVQTVAALLAPTAGAGGPDPGALLVGRHRDGTPLVSASVPDGVAVAPNDFGYLADLDGDRCPLAAHVRKMNPRGTSSDPDDEPRHLMVRRGQTYGVHERAADGSFADLPATGVGLLFLSFNGSITRQFEHVTTLWAEDIGFPTPVPDGSIDQVIGRTPANGMALPSAWGSTARTAVPMHPPFVRMRGGEYFFAPSLTRLERIATGP